MYGHPLKQIGHQPGKIAKPARGQLNREHMHFPPSPFTPDDLVSRDGFGRPVPRQPDHSPHSGCRSKNCWSVLRFPLEVHPGLRSSVFSKVSNKSVLRPPQEGGTPSSGKNAPYIAFYLAFYLDSVHGSPYLFELRPSVEVGSGAKTSFSLRRTRDGPSPIPMSDGHILQVVHI